MDPDKKLREYISALADGELPASECELALAALDTRDGQATWRACHVIGDVLRSAPAADLSGDFNARLAQRLAAEPVPVADAAADPMAQAVASPAAGCAADALEDQPVAIIFR